MDEWTQEMRARYKHVRVLGNGAFGEVALAVERAGGRRVAIKRVFVRRGAGRAAALREARALQAVAHPNVVRLHTIHAEGFQLHLVQELCLTDLSHVLAACYEPLPPAVVKTLMAQLLHALRACHDAGVMHRDVKPSNLLLSFDGRLKLGDFGLARGMGPEEGDGDEGGAPASGGTGPEGGESCSGGGGGGARLEGGGGDGPGPGGGEAGGTGGGGMGPEGGEGDEGGRPGGGGPGPHGGAAGGGGGGPGGRRGSSGSQSGGRGGSSGGGWSSGGGCGSGPGIGGGGGSGRGGAGGGDGCYSAAVATRWYRAPELLYGARRYDGAAVDVWGAGMVLAELIGLAPLVPGTSDIGQLALMQQLLGSFSLSDWPEAAQLPDWGKVLFDECPGLGLAALLPGAPGDALDLLGRMLRYPPYERPSAADALRHEYFSNAPAPATEAELAEFVSRALARHDRVSRRLAAAGG